MKAAKRNERCTRIMPFLCATIPLALQLVKLPNTQARQPETPPLNILRGLVISKVDGKPLGSVPVVMAHSEKGYLQIGPHGQLAGSGQQSEDRRAFATRNAKTFCDAFTNAEGHFTLRSFTAPSDAWNLAVGDREHGLALLTGVVPAEYADSVLRIEVDEPADIIVDPPPEPADKSLKASVDVALAPSQAPEPTQPDIRQPAEPKAEGADKAAELNVYVYPSWHPRNEEGEETEEPWHLGPFPPGFKYRVMRYVYGRRLSYRPTMFERAVFLAPGASETVSLESEVGATITGRITDTKDSPLADVNVMVEAHDGSGLVVGTLTDNEGSYELNGVPAGAYTLELLRHVARAAPT